jgi:hypothetical protein
VIQGFETRELTDQVIRPFVKSANGKLHIKSKSVEQYEQTNWPTFNKNDLTKHPIAVFGILRGTGELIKECQRINHTYYHFDHAYYFKEQKHGKNSIFNDRIYRLTKNGMMLSYIDKLDDTDKQRLIKFKKHIQIKPWTKKGDYILVLPPSEHVNLWYDFTNWEEDTVNKLKQYTQREIRVRKKDSKTPFMEELKNAWAVITSQSTAAVDAIINGVPSFCDEISMAKPVSHTDLSLIETPLYSDKREEWLDSLLSNQYLMSEIENGFAWNRVKNK